MNRREHLLTILSEECDEIGQRVSKALRFGLGEVQPGQPWSNAERIREEVLDFTAVLHMCLAEGLLPDMPDHLVEIHMAQKRAKVERFLEYSAKLGTLKE